MVLLAALFTGSCFDSSQFAAAIAKAQTLELLEGLPHTMFEKDLLEKERTNQKVTKVEGFYFYDEVRQVKPEDAATIINILKDSDNFGEFPLPKHCGGFHPDFALRFKHRGKTYQALICYGCDEAGLFGPGIDSTVDVVTEHQKKLEKPLKNYSRRRPKSHLWK